MNTRHAHLILTIVQSGSFTAAAKALFITQPTLSQTVKQIEAQLGEPIFFRGRTPVELTPAGELYVQAARRMLKVKEQLDEAISALHGRTSGTLHLGLPARRAEELLPQVLPDFTAAFPDMRIEAVSTSYTELEKMLLNEELDMALLSGSSGHPDLEYHLVASDEIVLLAGQHTQLAQRIPSGSTISLSECDGERFVMPSAALPERKIYDDLMESRGLSAPALLVCDDLPCAKRVCEDSSLLMFSPFISLLSDGVAIKNLAHYHLTDAFLPPMLMAHSKALPLSPCADALYKMMSSRFRSMTAYRTVL